MTIALAIREATEALEAASETPRLDAELLMAHLLGITRSDLLLRHMQEPVVSGYAALVVRRMKHEPVAYITGIQEFYGLEFIVNCDVLIPRGDSEVMVDKALAAQPYPSRVLDCGTGSGALLLAVLANLSQADGVGIERSQAALEVAAANAARLGLAKRARLLKADWREPGWADSLGRFDLILANPPYVEDTAELSPSVRDHEPSAALFAGPEGLDDYRILIPQLAGLLTGHGVALVEIGATQAAAVSAMATVAGFSVKLHRDLANRPRALELAHSNEILLGKVVPVA